MMVGPNCQERVAKQQESDGPDSHKLSPNRGHKIYLVHKL